MRVYVRKWRLSTVSLFFTTFLVSVGYYVRSTSGTVDHWERTFAINTRGVSLCYKYAGIQMIKQDRGGPIIGAASAAAHKGQRGLERISESPQNLPDVA